MEENINIFALVLDELNKNDMWFTTKADPTAEEASSYYKLDEYGEPTEATVKKIEKEVTSLIGDGAVYIEDAVELWVNDALVDYKIDYKDNLVTQFEDKPVVDNIEAYENPVQFPQSKKVEAKTKKTEYYKMPDDEHIIWDSEVDYYDDDYMEEVRNNQYQDYLNDLGEDETPEDFETWYEDYVEVASYDDNNYLVEDLEENILPEIDKQVNDDFIFMDAYYGSNYPDFRKSQGGGAIFKNGIDGLKNALTQYDRSCVTTKDGIIGVIFDDHDGTHTGTLFTTPDNKVELLKALGYEDIIKKEYDEEDLERYNHNDLMEQEFEEDLYYNNVDVGKVCEYIDLLKPIKDTISGYANKSESKKAERKKKQIEAFKNRKVNFNKRTKDKKFEALEDNFYSAFDSHGFRRKINKDTTIEELMNELYNFITFENISQDDMRKAIRDIVNHINVQFNANLDPERMYLWYINGNYGGTYEKVRKNKITENYQRRLDEVNNKSKNLISDLFSSNDFDSDSPAGQIVMRTSEMFNALSDKGYDVEVTFDNGESTSAIQLGQQGGKVMITITNTDQPLRAFTSGNFEINDQNIKILQDIQSQIEVL